MGKLRPTESDWGLSAHRSWGGGQRGGGPLGRSLTFEAGDQDLH